MSSFKVCFHGTSVVFESSDVNPFTLLTCSFRFRGFGSKAPIIYARPRAEDFEISISSTVGLYLSRSSMIFRRSVTSTRILMTFGTLGAQGAIFFKIDAWGLMFERDILSQEAFLVFPSSNFFPSPPILEVFLVLAFLLSLHRFFLPYPFLVGESFY